MHSSRDQSASVPHLRWLAPCLLLAFVLTSSRAATPGDPPTTLRLEFQQAYGRIHEASTSSADSAALRDYVLYPYLQAARLSQALDAAGAGVPAALDEQIAAFIRTHEGEPLAQDLRRSWLASLAERSSWNQFLAFHRDASDGSNCSAPKAWRRKSSRPG
jgi:soluble lytic murein transglycosylase